MPAKVLLVDDHQIVRDGLRLLFCDQPDLQVVGDAFGAEAAWRAVEGLKPDLIVLDVELPDGDGLAFAERVRAAHPEIKIVILTAHAEKEYVNHAMRIGVAGYLLKLNPASQLLEGVRAAVAGQVYLCPEVSTVLVREYKRQLHATGRDDGLTAREIDVLKRMADGQTTKEVAFALKLSVKTVETHCLKLKTKLGLRNVAELTKYALREGLTKL
jgi:DNA-binding NarL/FixJ family response regulator